MPPHHPHCSRIMHGRMVPSTSQEVFSHLSLESAAAATSPSRLRLAAFSCALAAHAARHLAPARLSLSVAAASATAPKPRVSARCSCMDAWRAVRAEGRKSRSSSERPLRITQTHSLTGGAERKSVASWFAKTAPGLFGGEPGPCGRRRQPPVAPRGWRQRRPASSRGRRAAGAASGSGPLIAPPPPVVSYREDWKVSG